MPRRETRSLYASLRRGIAVVLLCLALPFGVGAANPTEPAAIAALRADQSRTAAQLEAEAARLRMGTQDPKFRAWATLAEAEFANDQEHAEAALSRIDQAIAQADALGLPDLRFEALIRLSTILVNRGQSKETAAVLAKMQALVEAGGNPRWRALWLHERGVPCFYIHGNRDLLLGDAYARRARMTLLSDPSLVEIAGERVLLMHGDTLCTDDAPYQAFRKQTHDPAWQRAFLARPAAERRAFAEHARAESQRYTKAAGDAITDVSPDAVVATMRSHGVQRLLHGHTHRPAIHALAIDGRDAKRIVLGDWYEQKSSVSYERDIASQSG